MDYHPVFGERTAKEGSLMRKIWGVFSWFDRFAVGKTRLFVCLDDAMRELVEKRFKGAKTLISPTFPAAECDFFDLAKKTPSGPIKFLYSGNLGEAHPTENFEILLKKLSARTRTHLSYCGRMEHSRARLEALAARAGAEFEAHAFIKNYSDMGKFYAENAFDYGVVILDEKFKGVVSPSKFSGYSSFGLPILYLGPRGTNASLLCGKFGAGVEAADAAEIDACVEKLLNPETQPKCAAATKGSVEYFSARAAEGVAAALLRL